MSCPSAWFAAYVHVSRTEQDESNASGSDSVERLAERVYAVRLQGTGGREGEECKALLLLGLAKNIGWGELVYWWLELPA
jgi:hypothetical protein